MQLQRMRKEHQFIIKQRALWNTDCAQATNTPHVAGTLSCHATCREMYLKDVFPSYTASLSLLCNHSQPPDTELKKGTFHSPCSIYRWNLFIQRHFIQHCCKMKINHIPQATHFFFIMKLYQPELMQSFRNNNKERKIRCRFPGTIWSDVPPPFYCLLVWFFCFASSVCLFVLSHKPWCFFIFPVIPVFLDSVFYYSSCHWTDKYLASHFP